MPPAPHRPRPPSRGHNGCGVHQGAPAARLPGDYNDRRVTEVSS